MTSRFEGSSCFLSSLRLCVTVSCVEDNFQGENGAEFSQNSPSHSYEINY